MQLTLEEKLEKLTALTEDIVADEIKGEQQYTLNTVPVSHLQDAITKATDKGVLLAALKRHRGIRAHAAIAVGWSRSTVQGRIKAFGFNREDYMPDYQETA